MSDNKQGPSPFEVDVVSALISIARAMRITANALPPDARSLVMEDYDRVIERCDRLLGRWKDDE